MSQWSLSLKHAELQSIYDAFDRATEDAIDLYVSFVALNVPKTIMGNPSSSQVAASQNFGAPASYQVPMITVATWQREGRLDQMMRANSITAILDAFVIAFAQLRSGLQLATLPAATVAGVPLLAQSVLTAHHIGAQYGISTPLPANPVALVRLSHWLAVRDLLIAHQGRVTAHHLPLVGNKWGQIAVGTTLMFDQNEVDAVYWDVCSHVKGFFEALDKAALPAFAPFVPLSVAS